MLFISKANMYAQPPDTVWTKLYGGSGDDRVNSANETSDGGFIIAGSTKSFGAGQNDVYIIKTDSDGDTIWTRTYGGLLWDVAYSIQQTLDGGYIITGYTYSFGAGNSDLYLIKTNSIGDTLWTRTYGGEFPDGGVMVREITGGGYIILGYTESFGNGNRDIWLLKTNEVGDTLWTETFGGAYQDYAGSMQQTTDEGYIIAGSTDIIPSINYAYLIKTDANGDILWSRTFWGGDFVSLQSIEQTLDGGYIIGISSYSYSDSDCDIYLLKTYPSGDSTWARVYGGAEWDQVFSVDITSDQGYLIAGYTESFGAGSEDVYVIKTDSLGTETWSVVYGGVSDDVSHSALQTTDEGYMIAGNTLSFGVGSGDIWLLRLASETDILKDESFIRPSLMALSHNFPNPFNTSTTIEFSLDKPQFVTLKVYDLLGREIKTLLNEEKPAGRHRFVWNALDRSSGLYFYRMEAGDFIETRKMILLK